MYIQMDGMGDLYFFHFTFWLVFFGVTIPLERADWNWGKRKSPRKRYGAGVFFGVLGLKSLLLLTLMGIIIIHIHRI